MEAYNPVGDVGKTVDSHINQVRGNRAMFILRNYNKFLVHGEKISWADGRKYLWVDFQTMRYKSDLEKIVKFEAIEQAQKFIDKHPEFEQDFKAWIIQVDETDWEESYWNKAETSETHTL